MTAVTSTTSEARQAHGLPGGITSFVGRRREISEARRLLLASRLLTLTGPGGVGKTRLAVRLADTVAARFKDGVSLVELATLEDADLLESAVATALGLYETGPEPVTDLIDCLAGKRALLILDGCEHLLHRCALLVDALLRGAPRLRIMTTTRQTFGVAGERILPVPPLAVPESGRPVREIARSEAVRLFAERAAAVRPGFVLDRTNADAVARLCGRVEGLPLAIELAAARLRSVPVERLAAELDERFDVLEDGRPDALPRHRALGATIDWSHALCSPAEQRLWRRLSIFVAGADLETAEAVCAGRGIAREDVFGLLAGLMEKSIITAERRGRDPVRYRMLDSIRAYGRRRVPPDEEAELRGRYCRHYGRLAERTRIDRLVPDQIERFRTLQAEIPNLRVALELCLGAACPVPVPAPGPRERTAGAPEPGERTAGAAPPDPRSADEPPAALRIASALWGYWMLVGSISEGRYWLDRCLAVAGPSPDRATALAVASMLAFSQGDAGAAAPLLRECRSLADGLGDERSIAFARRLSGVEAMMGGSGEHGFALLEDALAGHRAAGDVHAVGHALFLSVFGAAEYPDRVAEFAGELLRLCEERNAPIYGAYARFALGIAAWRQGERDRAEAVIRAAAGPLGAIGDRWGLTQCLEALAWAAGARGRHDRAACLLGAAHRMWQLVGASPDRLPYHAPSHERCVRQARESLGDRAFEVRFQTGLDLGLDRAVAYALADDAP